MKYMPDAKIKLNKRGKIELSEAQIVQQSIDYLRAHGWLCLRLQSGMFRSMDDRRAVRIGEKGMPDWLVINTRVRPHAICFIEFKTLRGKLSKEQKLWQANIHKMGLKVIVVRGLRDLAVLS